MRSPCKVSHWYITVDVDIQNKRFEWAYSSFPALSEKLFSSFPACLSFDTVLGSGNKSCVFLCLEEESPCLDKSKCFPLLLQTVMKSFLQRSPQTLVFCTELGFLPSQSYTTESFLAESLQNWELAALCKPLYGFCSM